MRSVERNFSNGLIRPGPGFAEVFSSPDHRQNSSARRLKNAISLGGPGLKNQRDIVGFGDA